MQIVIDICDEKYDVIKSDLYNTFPAEMKSFGLEAIRNGTPLPKGHGRLIDADALKDEWREGFHRKMVEAIMDDAPTIIEAESEE